MAKKRSKAINVDLLEAEYASLSDVAQRFADEVVHQLDTLLAKAQVSLSFPIQRRVKTWAAIAEKLQRTSLQVSTLHELQDLVGFRVILQFRRDVSRVCQLLRNTFGVLDEYDTADRLREDQFGYSSTHFVVQLPRAWLALPAMAEMEALRAEIQVRTTAQHIWAAASHTLQYKNEASVPPLVRRTIHRVSALLETVDLEFERALTERDLYIQQLSAAAVPQEELNADLIAQILSDVWPENNEMPGYEMYGALISELGSVGIRTRDALEKLFRKHRAQALSEEKRMIADLQDRQDAWAKTRLLQERIARGVLLSHVGLTRVVLGLASGEPIVGVPPRQNA